MRALILTAMVALNLASASAQAIKWPISTSYRAWAGTSFPGLKATTDTLNVQILSDSLTLYGSPNGGYMSGNSGYGEYAKVQEFDIDSACGVEGFVFWFAKKSLNSTVADSSRAILAWYDMDSVTTVPDSGRLMPKTLLKTDTVLLSNIDTSSVFDGSVYLWQPGSDLAIRNFAAGLILDLLHPSDTLALWSTFAGNHSKQTWEFYLNTWTPMHYNWGIDVRFSILALIDRYAGLPETHANAVRIFPNPGQNFIQMRLPAALEQGGYMLLDNRGKIVAEQRFSGPSSTEIEINTTNLISGSYVLIVLENNRPVCSSRWVKL
jgi:hypothetical protein